jgi:hypothetical protein
MENFHCRMKDPCVSEVSREFIYYAPWDIVVQAYQRRFEVIPTPRFETIAGQEFSEFETLTTDEQVAQWLVKLFIRPVVPSWLMKLIGLQHVVFWSRNIIDHNNKTLTVQVRNESLKDLFDVNEKIVYSIHPENHNW